ncbi:MAG: hypothetical protein FWG56_11480 [Desulfovibrionaceae bacterium]|jgi:hypothetical protein|nr:hypothetical protein [Desulfovibrionaceae bacterium]
MDGHAHNPCYFGRGKLHVSAPLRADGTQGVEGAQPLLPAGELRLPPGRFVGNAKGLSIVPQLARLATSAWDARDNLIVQAVEATVQLYGHGGANLALALQALRSRPGSVPVTERHAVSRANVEAGSMLFVRHLVDVRQPVTVTPSWTTWTEGMGWEREAFGVRLLAGFAGPVGGHIDIAYTPEGSAESLDAFGADGRELGLSYTGLNAHDGRPVRLDCWRAAPALDGGVQPISESAGTLTLKFALRPVRAPQQDRPAWFRMQRGQYQ